MSDARTRVFLPILSASLRRLDEVGEVRLTTDVGYAVTALLRSAMPTSDDEDLEYAALSDAADACVVLSATPDSQVAPPTRGDGIRRIVVAADLGSSSVTEPSGRGRTESLGQSLGPESLVGVSGPLRRADVVSFHVGEPGGGADDELSWYDVSELALVIALLS